MMHDRKSCRLPVRLWPMVLVALAVAQPASAGDCTLAWDQSIGQPGMGSSVRAFQTFETATGRRLIAGGFFTEAGGVAVNRIAAWNGETWQPLGSGTNEAVLALTTFNDGAGEALFAAGEFTSAGGASARGIARWTGFAWSTLGSGLGGGSGRALAVFNDGSGPALYVGGSFGTAGGVTVNRIARWDGENWSGVGGGTTDTGASINCLAVFDDGSGSALYAAGRFTTIGGVAANNVARWDGQTWSPLGDGVDDEAASLAVYDDGSGSALYVGGTFDNAGGVEAPGIAKWDGENWSSLSFGLSGGLLGAQALLVYDSGVPGREPVLYVGGTFSIAGTTQVNNIAYWDGADWFTLGNGVTGGPLPAVTALGLFDDGVTGSSVYAGGTFELADGVDAMRIARWGVTGLPTVTDAPDAASVEIGDALVLSVAADSDSPLAYRWRRDEVILSDNDHISGSTTDTLTIDPVQLADQGRYDVLLNNDCGQVISPSALVTVSVTPGDLNADGIVNVLDLLLLLSDWGECPAKGDCPSDLNGDDLVNVLDMLALLSNWG